MSGSFGRRLGHQLGWHDLKRFGRLNVALTVKLAEALSRRTGPMLVQGRHNGASQGATASWSESYAEREQPLLLPHEVLQLDAEHVVAFAGGTPPARLKRIDWRSDRQLTIAATSARSGATMIARQRADAATQQATSIARGRAVAGNARGQPHGAGGHGDRRPGQRSSHEHRAGSAERYEVHHRMKIAADAWLEVGDFVDGGLVRSWPTFDTLIRLSWPHPDDG